MYVQYFLGVKTKSSGPLLRQLLELYKQCFPEEPIADVFPGDTCDIAGLYDGNTLIGWCAISNESPARLIEKAYNVYPERRGAEHSRDKFIYVYNFMIASSYAGVGNGTILLNSIKQKYPTAVIGIHCKNTRFWANNGFTGDIKMNVFTAMVYTSKTA